MPKRIQRQRTPGWRMPEGAVYVGRPGKWGNPWRITRAGSVFTRENVWQDAYKVEHIDGQILDIYRLNDARYWAAAKWWDEFRAGRLPVTRDDIRAELADRDLCCWCPPDSPCHADALLRIANGGAA